MSNFLFSVNVVVPLFASVILGYCLRRFNIVSDEFISEANKLGFRLFLPILIFYNIYVTDISSALDFKLMSYAVCSIVLLTGVLLAFIPMIVKDNGKRGVLVQGIMRSNFVLFGTAMAENMFGKDGLGPATLLVALIIPLFNVLAVISLSIFSPDLQKQGHKTRSILLGIAKNPLIIATLIGIAFVVFKIKLPTFLEKSVAEITKMSSPFTLMALGGGFTFSAVGKNLRYITLGVLGKLVVAPGILLFIAALLGFRGPQLGALLALYASPVAVSSYAMALQAKCDGPLAGQLVVFTTLLAVFTMFGFILIFRTLGYF